MSLYKEFSELLPYIQSVRKIEKYLSFDISFPTSWKLPKKYVQEDKVMEQENKIPGNRTFSFVAETNECLNTASVSEEFDFAISFHYDTPSLLNLPTYLWLANPIEFMHLRGDYRNVLFNQIRSYDGYLSNGAEILERHIQNVIGSEWQDSGLAMYASSSSNSLVAPSTELVGTDETRKVFYCGVNWEKGTDRQGRAQGLLEILQSENSADFFGPNDLEGLNPWDGFSSYKGEIPFDGGITMTNVMRRYGAVLAVSSPAHMKSQTSSSRVFEGFTAGVPVISDENPHVRKLFGDLVYYIKGDNEQEKALSIISQLKLILEKPEVAKEKVTQAQALIKEQYCFEVTFNKIHSFTQSSLYGSKHIMGQLDVQLFHHDPKQRTVSESENFSNLISVVKAATYASNKYGVKVVISCYGGVFDGLDSIGLPNLVELKQYPTQSLTEHNWNELKLGEKVSLMKERAIGDYAVFFIQSDFPHYDYFSQAINWFEGDATTASKSIFIAGFFISELQVVAPKETTQIPRYNNSNNLYKWTQNSLAEHQLGSLVFNKNSLRFLRPNLIERLDVTLPISVIASAIASDTEIHRSRFILTRTTCSYFHKHYEVYLTMVEKGFWSQHYDMVTNYSHELNALYDVHHESSKAIEIVDAVSGHNLSPAPEVDPAVHKVNQFLTKLRPIYRRYQYVKNLITYKKN